MEIYLPIAEISVSVLLLLGLGGGVGFLSGLFGVGGGFLMTPLLIFIGVPPAVAVATQSNQTVATSVSGKGVMPASHPLAVGWGYGKQGTRAAEAAFKDVDLVLAVGVRYSEVSTANFAIPRHDTLIHVDVTRAVESIPL